MRDAPLSVGIMIDTDIISMDFPKAGDDIGQVSPFPPTDTVTD
jgi:hypothetical protein